MIELIFVIVILGILAAVAVPKLSATRDDAKQSAILADYKSVINTISSRAMASGAMPDATTLFKKAGNFLNVTATQVVLGDPSSAAADACAVLDLNTTHIRITTIDATKKNCNLFDKEQTTNISVLGSAVVR